MLNTKIFISHRHDDAEIAKGLRNILEDWGVRAEEVFVSSDARGAGPLGANVREVLMKAAASTKLLLLVYTSAQEDWSWCTWECGLVEDPKTPCTKLVVIQCGDKAPKVYKDRLGIVASNKETIKSFVRQFHVEPDFLPGEGIFSEDCSDELLKRRAARLEKVLDRAASCDDRRIYRWSYILFRANLDTVARIKELPKIDEIDNQSLAEIAKGTDVYKAEGHALEHFGYAKGATNLTLADLAERWKQATDSKTAPWLGKLCREFCRGALEYSPKLKLTSVKSAYEGGGYKILLINNELTFLRSGEIEYLVNTYKEEA